MPRRTTPPDRARPRPAASSASSPPPLPSSARAGGVDPLFTELDTRRLGPVRRYFVRHPVAMDRLVAALYAVPAIGAALLEETAPSADAEVTLRGGPAAAVLLAVAVLGGVALLWRRRAPLRTALVIGALAVVTVAALGTLNGLDLAIAFVLYAVAASSPPRTAWLTLTASLVVVGAAVLAWERPLGTPLTAEADTGARVGSFTGLLILYLVALAIGTGVRNRRLHVASVVDRANALAVVREQGAQLAAAAERARIAREMHDVVAHSLSVMIALADGAGVALERSPARSREALEELSATGRSALADMRRVLGALRDPGTGAGGGPGGGPEVPLDPQPGSSDLERLVEGFRTAGVPVRWTVSGPPLPPDAGLQLAVYRIVQESLTNVLRHAPGATRVDVVLAAGTDRVDVVVTDTGAPTPPRTDGAPAGDPSTGSGRGLIGMRERAAVYGGRVEAGTHDGGWRVHATLHWEGGAP